MSTLPQQLLPLHCHQPTPEEPGISFAPPTQVASPNNSTTPLSPTGASLHRGHTLASIRSTHKRAGIFARRVHGWSWQAFPIGMGTGAVYLTLSNVKYRNSVLERVQAVFYFLNVVLFGLNLATLLLQAILYPRQAKRLLTDPVKGVFVPLVVLSFATIVISTVGFAVPSHVSPASILALFWIYVASALVTCFPLLIIWFDQPHDLGKFTPAYAFLVFPIMLVGVVSFNVLKVMDLTQPSALSVLLVGYVFQGIGFFMTFFYLGIYILRIMTTGFLVGQQANGAFIACGPPGFTALALISLGEKSRVILSSQNLVSPIAGEVWYAASVMAGLLLFGLAVFFFIFGLIPWWHKLRLHLKEILGCWSLTFPNVGWISCLRLFGDIFNVQWFYVLHIVMTVFMCLTWLVLFVLTLTAFYKGKIFISKDSEVLEDVVPIRTWIKDLEKHRDTPKLAV